MSVNSGTVQIKYLDDRIAQYEQVTNVSISPDWVFMKFTNGRRAQIPSAVIRELYEEGSVYIKGREGKSNV